MHSISGVTDPITVTLEASDILADTADYTGEFEQKYVESLSNL